ncbi:MAG: glycosyl hydrolase [Bacteroidetes bacterium]|nr:MAG: glycosyl hydrolase [Bacteroidota bacterium]
MKLQTCLLAWLCLFVVQLGAQPQTDSPLSSATFSGLKFRNIGPAFASGRIADIAIHPQDESVWYVAVGSGGVWKTENAGVTWQPIFDSQPSYSIGCVTIDPNNPHTIWVGTGENVGGRHVGFGDGVYKSTDDGRSWKNMGLKASEHISKIIVHPHNSDIIFVAAQGPLWAPGGERGLYKSTDGGQNWKKVLGNEEWTGVTDIVMDPRNPDWLYAATWDRHRTVAAYMGGGPGSGIHRSTDGGESWEKLSKGLPNSNMGKIGLAISPQQPDILYAAIELDRTTGGVYRSTNRGTSWEKRSNAVSGATGPHYYQELYAPPHQFDLIYLVDVRIQVSRDGGKTFDRLPERDKHSDNHAIAFKASDPDYLLIGTDGGIYESFDDAANWRFVSNLPITQYYKVAVDDREPFYHIFGGTQDNGSHGGPSRTDNVHGIRNADWYKTLGADGHQSATEPGNPNIMYAETQQGGLHRVDLTTGEQVFIQPQAREGEKLERFNWDAPILVSPHAPNRLYFASYRVWRSDDRGDSWTPISGDLTRDQERITLPIMGKVQSWDNPWDVGAMSNYNTITSLAESPLQQGLIYAGTDDGIVQVTSDGGQNWTKIEVGDMPGVPATAFVNDIKADLFDANTVYVALDNHKYGDFKPYLLKSTNRGKSWKSIAANLPDRSLVWRLVQDHVQPNLMFLATEFGIYFTPDGGGQWIQLKGGLPTISFRDLTIQRRENDLVAASFGRGFFVLDDYSVLREVSEDVLKQEAALFGVRKAWWYVPRSIVSSQGASYYAAPNPPFGAVFTYHLAEGLSTLKSERKKRERELAKEQKDIPFPGWEALEEERREEKPKILLTVKDSQGKVVKRIEGPTSKGLHRVAWDLRHASQGPVSMRRQQQGGFRFGGFGFMAIPGTYTVSLSKLVDGNITPLAGPVSFEVVPLRQGALKGATFEEIAQFRKELESLQTDIAALNYLLNNSSDKVNAMKEALSRMETDAPELLSQLHQLQQQLYELDEEINGNRSKEEIGERSSSIRSAMFVGFRGLSTTYGPTPTHKQSLEVARKQVEGVKPRLKQLSEEAIPKLEKALREAGAPWIEGQPIQK